MTSQIIHDIDEAINLLLRGDLVAFPTETVYGLGAMTNQLAAVKRVFRVKNRPTNHPLIVHIGSIDKLHLFAKNISEQALKIARAFWPGPVTLLLEKSAFIDPIITGDSDKIAIRIPAHPITLKLLEKCQYGLVGPSANKFGKVSPTTALHVAQDFINDNIYVLDGGATNVGIESTILDVTCDQITIVRPGIINAQDIFNKTGITCIEKNNTANVPGSHKSHYAPDLPTFILNAEKIHAYVSKLPQQRFAILGKSFNCSQPNCVNIKMPENYIEYSKVLYTTLREVASMQLDAILIETPPSTIEWRGILDRISRASAAFQLSDLLLATMSVDS